MTQRFLAFAVLGGLALGGCGGGSRPVTFSSDNRPMLVAIVNSIKAKNKKQFENCHSKMFATPRADAEEKAALDKLKGLVDKDQWDAAKDFAEACQAASK
jgi:hypothetical protein